MRRSYESSERLFPTLVCVMTFITDAAIAWSGQLLYDFVIFLLTISRSLRARKEGSRSIADVLIRDGVSVALAPFHCYLRLRAVRFSVLCVCRELFMGQN